MLSDTKRAEDARQQGNVLYRACRIHDAIKAYKVAAALVPSDPTPLSNLSAASFEAGDYETSIRYSTEALALLQEEADDDPQKKKLLNRLTKARRYHPERPDSSVTKELLRNTLFCVPRYRPYLTNNKGYFPSGHDTPWSQYDQTLRKTTKDAEVVSIMFCGIGDARNMLQTMMHYNEQGPKSHQRLHFTILDVKATMLARDLILFALLDDISLTMALSQIETLGLDEQRMGQFVETLTVAAYFYLAQVMPAYAWDRIQAIIKRLLHSFDHSKQPISWVYIPATVQAAVRPTLESWKLGPVGPYSTQRVRELAKQEEVQMKLMMGMMSIIHDRDPNESFSHLKFDKYIYKNFSIVLPLENLLVTHDPKLVTILEDYRKKDRGAKKRLTSYIDSNWKPNLSLADILWERENVPPEYLPPPDMALSPFAVVEHLMKGSLGEAGTSPSCGNTLMEFATAYFMSVGGAIAALRHRMMVEVCVGEMAEFLEQIRYQGLDRSTETESKDCVLSAKSPLKYHVIHMSNIPDYVGGPFTPFLSGARILEHGPGTGVTSCNMRNPQAFETVSQYLSEYLIMYDRKLIQSHFQFKLTTEPPKDQAGPMLLMEYLLWEHIPQKPLTFEQLMPQTKFFHWLHSHFLKFCLPYPRCRGDGDPKLIYSPLNMTMFLRLVMHVSELGYPAHWISNLIEAILSGKITTTARPPPEQVLSPKHVDTVHPTRSFSTTPWILEFATLIGLWRSILRVGLVIPSSVPRVEDIVQYTIKFPGLEVFDGQVPHYMLVFCDEQTFGQPPQNLRPMLMEDAHDLDLKSPTLKYNGLRCVSTFRWSVKAQTATFWISKDAFEEMKCWKVFVWRIDVWEKEGKGVKLGNAVVQKKCWGEWEDPPHQM